MTTVWAWRFPDSGERQCALRLATSLPLGSEQVSVSYPGQIVSLSPAALIRFMGIAAVLAAVIQQHSRQSQRKVLVAIPRSAENFAT